MTAMNPFRLQYFFDPLCGWCYASAPALAGLDAAHPGVLELMPSGLFAGEGARELTPEWGEYAWRNDQRIEQTTGQRFTQAYREQVLRRGGVHFDSGPATRVLTALRDVDARLERPLLEAIQLARYVDGLDTARADVLARVAADVAAKAGMAMIDADALARRIDGDAALASAAAERIAHTQRAMRRLGASGVPQLLVTVGERGYVLHGASLYGGAHAAVAAVERVLQED
ncbi:DsbA family protein [Burkholderia thailandensis]|nr:DsbA family protein [Burkholderia thailandensis]AHI66786.1 DSBA-like thioredoxin domain protein [Burkholderia thailandensis H0587]AIP67196.1 DSBA oxidoreductase [Burkholderia thailandensis]AJY32300.1 DSBA-like thioredoxin domain protein [Burkholderia thailandensis 34]AOI56011.1 disulfide bond formation protein DsbA [Burkholderia thailandensis]AOJ54976.1 disulfide bond formation protein DsbA [Burkholderia thailandensis]